MEVLVLMTAAPHHEGEEQGACEYIWRSKKSESAGRCKDFVDRIFIARRDEDEELVKENEG